MHYYIQKFSKKKEMCKKLIQEVMLLFAMRFLA
nr:MAG TPA: hypothetical protein [Caudoviricetes sp.]